MSMLLVSIVLGIVEGLTEFLPISSTGHLIIVSDLLSFHGRRAELFQIFIQLGAILSVVWEFRERLTKVVVDLPTSPAARSLVGKLFVAFLPLAIIGLLFRSLILEYLFSPLTVAVALVVGALLIFVIEGMHLEVRTPVAEDITWTQAVAVGFAQCLALWPGFSRSAATILGGLTVGLGRRAATEFSFFLAIPVMFAATVYSLIKEYDALESGDLGYLALAFVVSFFVAWASIRWLLQYVSTHSFRLFAWYRLALGLILFLWLGR